LYGDKVRGGAWTTSDAACGVVVAVVGNCFEWPVPRYLRISVCTNDDDDDDADERGAAPSMRSRGRLRDSMKDCLDAGLLNQRRVYQNGNNMKS
jgi:hypothetical protein